MRRVMLAVLVAAWCGLAGAAEVAWTYTPPTGHVDASPAIGDLDGDGTPEIVVGTTGGMVVAIDASGREVWRRDVGVVVHIPPTVANVLGDDAPEVLAVNKQGEVYCLEGKTGAPLWNAALPAGPDWGSTALAVGDLDKDGSPEIVTGDMDNSVVCFTGAGKQKWVYRGDFGIASCPALADLDGDGALEVLISGTQVALVCLSSEGKERWRAGEGYGSSPVVCELNGDALPEVLTAIGHSLAAVDGKGKVLWSLPMKHEIDSSICAADADGDGRLEIYAADLSGYLVAVSPDGKLLWSGDVEERMRRSPSLGDVDGDGTVEILAAGYSGAIHVFDPQGRLETRVALDGASNATATLAVLGDAGLCVICPTTSRQVQAFRWPKATADARVLWPEYRFDARRTAVPSSGVKPPVTLEVNYGGPYVGTNDFLARVHNPERRKLRVSLQTVQQGSRPSESAIESSEDAIEHRLSYTLLGDEAVNLSFTCTVAEGDAILARRVRAVYVVPFAKEVADAASLVGDAEARLPRLADRTGLEERVYFLRHRLEPLRERAAVGATLDDADRRALRDELAAFLADARRVRQTVAAAEGHGPVLARAANPWAAFGGNDELMEERVGPAALTVEAFSGETESAALNVFNFSGVSRTFRVELDDLKQGDSAVPAAEAIALHEVVSVPTQLRDYSADALPELGPARLFTVPPWDARQLWLNVDTDGLTPGDWSGRVRLRSLEPEPVDVSADLKATVWVPRMPDKHPLRLCHWGYVHTSMLKGIPDKALEDQVSHGTNVFVGTIPPKAEFDAEGNFVGEIDFAAHDDYVKRHAPHGIILFFNYQTALKGPAPVESQAYAKAHVAWLRAWVKHLAELGVGYDGFALYPVDEPGLSDGLVERYLRLAQLAREADPKILLYTDPVGGIAEDELKAIAPYVDIWCPNRNGFLLHDGARLLEIIKATGKTVWTYECEGNVKHQSPLGYYRGQAWLAWHHGLTGIGFWSYCTSQDDPWFRPPENEYLLVYPGDDVVTSKRWEAVRDGIEDYSMLAALREAVQRPGAAAEDVAAAKRLLGDEASAIGAYCGVDHDGTQPGKDGLPGVRRVEDRRWERLQSARREMAALLSRLQASE